MSKRMWRKRGATALGHQMIVSAAMVTHRDAVAPGALMLIRLTVLDQPMPALRRDAAASGATMGVMVR